jgi:hypothetical protein
MVGRGVARRLAELARQGALLIEEVSGIPTAEHPIAPFLTAAGFTPSAMGFMMRRASPKPVAPDETQQAEAGDPEEDELAATEWDG